MRALAIFLTQLLLGSLVGLANYSLAGAHLYLFAGGLLVAYAALALPWGAGLAVSFLAGAVADAAVPVPFGTQALLFAAAHTLLFHLRDRLPRDDTTSRLILALLANLGLFLALSALFVGRTPRPAEAWLRLLPDLVASQVFVAFVAPWFFALQERAVALTRPVSPWR